MESCDIKIIIIKCIYQKISTELIIHLAAQPLVRKSYDYPIDTFTNFIGTMNILEVLRSQKNVKALSILLLINVI